MKYLIAAVLLAVVQTAPPVPRKAAHNSGSPGHSIKQNADADKKPAEPTPSIAQPVSPSPQQNNSAAPQSKDTEQAIRIGELPSVSVARDWIDKLGLVLTCVLIGIGALGVRAAYRTLKAVESQAGIMQGQLDSMQEQLRGMHEQITEMSAQTDALRQSVEAAKAGAIAAQTNADFLAASERAWVTIIPEAINDMSMRSYFPTEFAFKITNGGRTAAQIVEVQSVYQKRLRIDNLPDTPDFDGFEPTAFHDTVLTPDDAIRLTNKLSNSNDFSAENTTAVREGSRFLLAFGYVRYRDVFRKEHYTRFCFTYNFVAGDRINLHSFERYFDAPPAYTQSD